MEQPLFLGLDIGTQGTKTVLCDLSGRVVAESFFESVLYRPDAETVYEDADRILESVIVTIRQAVERSGAEPSRIRAIGMDAQMAGIMAIDSDFNAATPLDSWLDCRCAPYTDKIEKVLGDAAVESSGGQIIHAHASKILWWKNEHPEAYAKIAKFVQPNGFVAGKLCGLKAEDAFMDYTFLHFNVFSDNRNLCFNRDLLSAFGVEEEKMPRIVDPKEVIGTLLPEYAERCGLCAGVQVIAGCGDTAASSLGAGITEKGLAYDVAGTASVFACCTDRFEPDVKNRTLLFSRSVCDGLFLPLSYIAGGGLCLRWFSDMVGKDLKSLDEAAKQVPAGCGNLLFLPHFSGRTFPLDNAVRGAFIGMDSTTDRAAMYRAILESVAYEYKSYLEILLQSGALDRVETVCGIGGGAKSEVFSQLKADVLGSPYTALCHVDSAPVAMALLAAKSIGCRTEPLREIFRFVPQENRQYLPDRDLEAVYAQKAKQYLSVLNGYSAWVQ